VKNLADRVKHLSLLEENKDKFTAFSTAFAEVISSALETVSEASQSQERALMWTAFHKVRESKLPALWRTFLEGVDCRSALEEPLFMELVNETYFENLIKQRCAHPPQKAVMSPSLTTDEENIIRYACGYVGMKLHDRFIKQDGKKAEQFVECIDSMHVAGPTSSFLDYTRECVSKVNRGGLFYVSDNAYNLFVALEIAMQVSLTNHIHSSYKLSAEESRARKNSIVDSVVSNDDVLFHWYILAIDITNEKEGLELLRHITELWLTIRGYSISKSWMEDYKKQAHMQMAQKSLRKEKRHDEGNKLAEE